MRTGTIASVQYAPGIPPSTYSPLFLQIELGEIASAIAALSLGHLDPCHVAPLKPRNGDIRYADGTDWNPGSGEGFYGYENGSWVKL